MAAGVALAALYGTIPVPILVIVVVLGLLEIGLAIFALVDLYRRPTDRVALANKWIWMAIILLVNLVGPILYLAIARKPAVQSEGPAAPPPNRMEQVVDSLYGPRDGSAPS